MEEEVLTNGYRGRRGHGGDATETQTTKWSVTLTLMDAAKSKTARREGGAEVFGSTSVG